MTYSSSTPPQEPGEKARKFVGLSGHIFFVLVPRFPSKSGLMNKHIVKHIVEKLKKL
jgi:hypothetical protein